MPEVTITIGERNFDVSCQTGEEHFLHSAAKMIDDEAKVLIAQIGRMPEARMLLMSALLLADKTAALEERLREADARLLEQAGMIATLRNASAPAPQRIEVEVVPDVVFDTLAAIAARTEALAGSVADKLRG